MKGNTKKGLMTKQCEELQQTSPINKVKRTSLLGFIGGSLVKNPPANAGTRVQSLVGEDLCHGETKPMHHNY